MMADFDAVPSDGEAPLTVVFTDRSSSTIFGAAEKWTWSFGDGSSSTLRNPAHLYAVPGTYTVRLEAMANVGSDEFTERGTVEKAVVVRRPLSASFDYRSVGPLTIQFTETSTGDVTGRYWWFGDGATSSARNPEHTYPGSGSYTVRLGVLGPRDEFPRSTAEKTVLVEPTPTPTPTPITATPTPTRPPTTIPVTYPPSLILHPTVSPQGDTVTVEGSVAPGTAGTTVTRVNWNWGDGASEDHTVPNTHIYAAIGSYTIAVTAFQSDGQTTTRSMTIFASGPTETTVLEATTTSPPTTAVPPAVTTMLTATATTVPPTGTVATVTPTVTGVQPQPDLPWWLAAIIAAGLLAGGVAVAKGWPGVSPPEEPRVPGLTIEARGGLRRPGAEERISRNAEIGIEVRGGIRRER